MAINNNSATASPAITFTFLNLKAVFIIFGGILNIREKLTVWGVLCRLKLRTNQVTF
jgi:hypothetical protein